MKLLFISPNNVYATGRIIEECGKQGIDVTHFASAELKASAIDVEEFDVLYVRFAYPNFEEIAKLAKKFKTAGKAVVDAVIAEGEIDPNKLADYHKLSEASIDSPKSSEISDFTKFKSPLIVKTKYGFGKKEVFMCSNSNELEKVKKDFADKDLLIQELIKADFEYKVICAGFKSLPKVIRFKMNSSGFGINNTEYEVFDANECREVVKLVEAASKVLGRELCKADVLQSGPKYYVIEVNRSPGLKNFERLTGYNAAGAFVKYLMNK